ncbi:MAG: PEGA domain-containing protein [Xanthomonadales bacterium]|nr:PEGA domain-containing protein [Xanthomonadales bacterium]MCB1635415.1 PEGA domain-containing protein [Xanthomonadales bacterium]MCB1640274.1 PEGA domain-containing protein [Xanthomonadales bacterium]
MSRSAELLMLLLGLWMGTALQAATPRIAVVDFDAHQYAGDLPGAQLADYVVDELVNLGRFEVIEREKLASIRNELNFGASGYVDAASAPRIGQLLGASHLLTGRVISVEREQTTLNNAAYGVSGRNTVWKLSISIRVFETASGKIVYSNRSRSQWVARETASVQTHTTTPYDRLAEQAAIDVVAGLRDAPFGGQVGASAAARINVRIESQPSGADIEVDGLFIGNTDGDFALSPGVRLIRISLGGLPPWEKKVEVTPGLSIKARLQP